MTTIAKRLTAGLIAVAALVGPAVLAPAAHASVTPTPQSIERALMPTLTIGPSAPVPHVVLTSSAR